jgi:acetyl-CoA C-acetyltransferase
MASDPRAPVIVGVGAVTEHATNATDALTAFDLMVLAAARADADTGVAGVLGRTDLVLMPRGTWSYRDPGRMVAERFGVDDVRSVIGEIGVLQQTMLTRAAQAVAHGDADVVLVCGAEAKHRALLGAKAGIELDDPDPSRTDADDVVRPVGDILSRTEVERELAVPAHQYATIESAIAHAEGRSPAEQQRHVAELWARFAAVAVTNPDAWDRSGPSADVIGTAGPDNRAIAMPYTKLLCSQWNVDQAAAIVLMAQETADRIGIARDRRVFAHAAAESNQMVLLPCRADIHRWPAFEAVVDALGLRQPDAVQPTIMDIYSCFPAAVQVQARALGLSLESPLTVSGGMTFGGGPLNHSALQAMVPLVRALREAPEALGLSTSVSGMITKPGASLWSATPPKDRFLGIDVTETASAHTAVRELLPDVIGHGIIAAHTVVYDGGEPARAIVVLDVEGGRTIARSGDPAIARSMTEADWVGRDVEIVTPGAFEAV